VNWRERAARRGPLFRQAKEGFHSSLPFWAVRGERIGARGLGANSFGWLAKAQFFGPFRAFPRYSPPGLAQRAREGRDRKPGPPGNPRNFLGPGLEPFPPFQIWGTRRGGKGPNPGSWGPNPTPGNLRPRGFPFPKGGAKGVLSGGKKRGGHPPGKAPAFARAPFRGWGIKGETRLPGGPEKKRGPKGTPGGIGPHGWEPPTGGNLAAFAGRPKTFGLGGGKKGGPRARGNPGARGPGGFPGPGTVPPQRVRGPKFGVLGGSWASRPGTSPSGEKAGKGAQKTRAHGRVMGGIPRASSGRGGGEKRGGARVGPIKPPGGGGGVSPARGRNQSPRGKRLPGV